MMRDAGCSKMSLCATVEQNEEITFLVFDSRKRTNATVSALLHHQNNEEVLSVHEVETFLYQFTYLDSTRGVDVLEVFVDGVQIPSSPFRVEVASRDCEVDFPGVGKVAGAFGVVLLADYHGTKVAIKRVLPLQPKRRARGTDSVPTVQSHKSGPPVPVVEANSDVEAGVHDGSSRQQTADTSSADENESSSDGFDFLTGASLTGRKGALQRWFPFFQSSNSARSKLNILGTASGGSTSHKSLLARILPMCDENTRRQEAFLNEMRLLSRLRHPCTF
eukprot:scaffold10339_cov101-Cylindrotheca_fusiformis.AAC.1